MSTLGQKSSVDISTEGQHIWILHDRLRALFVLSYDRQQTTSTDPTHQSPTASGSTLPFCHNTLCRHRPTDRQIAKWSVTLRLPDRNWRG